MISCAFTGHRPAHFHFTYNENHPDCISLKQDIKREILALIEKGVTTFYTGMALGVDMWAAESVLELKAREPKLRLVAVLPCQTQADRWPGAQRVRHAKILSQCDEVVCISANYTSSCMLERNRYMVDNAACLLAVYDGKDSGGTAYTVGYARRNNRNVIVIPSERYSVGV